MSKRLSSRSNRFGIVRSLFVLIFILGILAGIFFMVVGGKIGGSAVSNDADFRTPLGALFGFGGLLVFLVPTVGLIALIGWRFAKSKIARVFLNLLVASALMPLIAFGVFAAISILGSHNYTVRAQVHEGLNLAMAPKAAVAEYYQVNKQFPSDNVAAGIAPATDIQGKYVSSVRIEAGEIVVTYGNDADSDILGDTLVIRPDASGKRVTFVCFSLDIASKHLPAACR